MTLSQTPNLVEQDVKKGDYQQAIEGLSQAINANPNNAKAYLNRASLYILLRDYQKANEDLHKAADISVSQGDEMLHKQAVRQLDLTRKLQSQ